MIYLVDYENVQSIPGKNNLNDSDSIVLFVGASQNGIRVDIVKQLLEIKNAEIIQASAISKNNIDFHICFYLGKFAEQGFRDFTVISKDKGYDNLLKHLNTTGLNCRRIELGKVEDKTEDALIEIVIEVLNKQAIRNRPRKVKTLSNFITTQILSKEQKKDKSICAEL